MGHSAKYDEDFYAWTMEQATRLREAAASGANLPLDWENLAEEIESMGRSDFRGVRSFMIRIVEHLLKLEYSPAADPRNGWRESVGNARTEANLILDDSPSLQRRVDEALALTWKDGRRHAAEGLERDGGGDRELPKDCPYTAEQVLDPGWWPENRHGLT